jgi:hypothetical protein
MESVGIAGLSFSTGGLSFSRRGSLGITLVNSFFSSVPFVP